MAPRQSCSQATLELEAAEALLNERDLEALPIADIVERAGSSVGSFYARFPSKEALAEALLARSHEAAVRELVEVQRQVAEDASLAERAGIYISRVVAACRQRRGLLKLRLRRRMARDRTSEAAEAKRDERVVTAIRSLFEPVLDDVRHPDPEAALSFALRMVDSRVASTLLMEDIAGSFRDIDDQRLIEEQTRAFVVYLEAAPAP